MNLKKFWGTHSLKSKQDRGLQTLKYEDKVLQEKMKRKQKSCQNILTVSSPKNLMEDFQKFHQNTSHEEFTNFSISKYDILKKLNKPSINKSPGPDAVHPYVVKEIRHDIAAP